MPQDLQASLNCSVATSSGSSTGIQEQAVRMPGHARAPRVCVVGAGISGLRCADVLLRNGVEVEIFEARGRIGGRVHQESLAGNLIDLGANWIHGSAEHDPIFAIARKVGTVLGQDDDLQICIDSDGNPLTEAESVELITAFFTQFEQACRYSAENAAEIPVSTSFFDFLEAKSADLFPDERKRLQFLEISYLWGSYIGGTIHTQSLKFLWLEQCLDKDNKFLASTYQKILQHIAEPVLNGAKVSLDTEIEGVKSLISDGGSGVEVRTVKGETHSFDHVVVTVPLGALKRRKDMFEPPLPIRLSQAIDAINYGNLDKAWVTFPSAWWDIGATTSEPAIAVPQTKPDETQHESIHHEVNTTSSASHNAGFIHWDRPNYSPSNPRKWNLEGMNLAALPDSCAHPTLLFYFSDDCSKYIASLLAKSPQSTPEGQRVLIDFFEPYYSRLPNWNPSDPACKPVALLASNWASDRLAGHGSYCNFHVGLERGDEHIAVMRDGMPERGIWLAGEHTSPLTALGTVTGAYMSGESVARRILEAYGISAKS